MCRWACKIAITAACLGLAPLLAHPAGARMLGDWEFNPGHLSWATAQGSGYWTGQCWVNDSRHVFKWRGLLQLTATYEPSGGACGTGYESGAVYVPDAWWHYMHGWAAARVRVPCQSGFGLWPGFWQYAQSIPSSNVGGEIDTFEEMDFVAKPRRTVEQSLHSVAPTGTDTIGQLRVRRTDPYCRAFHTFTNHWQANTVSFYVDGHKAGTLAAPDHTLPESPVLSLLVGGFGGTPQPWTFPQSLLVDWVRVWR